MDRERTTGSYRLYPSSVWIVAKEPRRRQVIDRATSRVATRDRGVRIRDDRRSGREGTIMPPKRRAPARGAAKKAADVAGNRDILIIEVIEGPAMGTKFTPTVRKPPKHQSCILSPSSPRRTFAA